MKVEVQLLSKDSLREAQRLVAEHHYLHRPVDPRCSPVGYGISIEDMQAGVLIFGRPEATRCGEWYGSVEDSRNGKCEITRWQLLNLARVWIDPAFQTGGEFFNIANLPGFYDRKGQFRSTLAGDAINAALDRIGFDYLIARPLCFPWEPYEILWALSYCDPRYHRGALYRAAGFELYRTNKAGLQTWRKRLRPLTEDEHIRVLDASMRSERSREYRARRAQLAMEFA